MRVSRRVNTMFHHTTPRGPMMYVMANRRTCRKCGRYKAVSKGCRIGRAPVSWFVCAECATAPALEST